MGKGTKVGLPEAKEPKAWFYDVLNFVTPFVPVWTSGYKMNKRSEADNGTLTYRTLAYNFRQEIQDMMKRGSKGYAKGSFGVTYSYNLSQPDREEGDALEKDQQTSGKGRGNKRSYRSTTGDS